MLSSIEKLFRAFDENGIHYCHWKSNEHLGEALEGDTDLDILFDFKQRSELEQVFSMCGLKRFRATPLMQYNAIEDYIGFDQEDAKIWHVHTHYRMTLGEKHLKGYTITPWGNLILENRIKSEDGIWISSPSDEFVLILCRIALKLRWRDLVKKLGKDDIVEIAWLRERITMDSVVASANNLVGNKSVESIRDLFNSNISKKRQFVRLQKSLRKEFKPFTGYDRFGSWMTRSRREAFWFIGGVQRRLGLSNFKSNRRISPAGGLVVSILGSDGAGKSTTIDYLKKEFNKKIDTVSIYLGSGDGSSSLLRKPMKIVAKKVGGKGVGHAVEKEYQEKEHVSMKSRFYSLGKIVWAITLAKEKNKKLKQITRARNNGLLVLTDRYPQIDTPGAGDGPLLNRYFKSRGLLGRIARWEYQVYKRFSINPPDLAVKLIVPTEIALNRKPEMTREEIVFKRNIVLNMNIAKENVTIDTSAPFEITRGEVMSAIWNMI